MPEINLLQPKKDSSFGMPKVSLSGSFFIWLMMGLIVLELLGWGAIYYWRESIETEAQNLMISVNELDAEIAGKKTKIAEAVRVQGALATFTEQLRDHIYWTRVWDEVGRHTLKWAEYVSLNATVIDRQFIVEGTVPDQSYLAKLLLGLEGSAEFDKVELQSASPSDGEVVQVHFQILIKVKPSLLTAEDTVP